jgi:hypothetical protein
VNVVLGHIRQLVVHDLRQLFDIEPARRNLGRNQRNHLVRLEIRQCPHARRLTLVAMNGRRANPVVLELLGKPIRTVLGPREHQHLMPVALVDEMRKQVPLVLLRHAIHLLIDTIRGGIARSHFHADRIAQKPPGQLANVFRVGGREHQVLPHRRQQLEHLLDLMNEPHVEHAIRFVQHEVLHAAQIERALILQIEQPTGCGNEQIAPVPERIDLRIDPHAAEHDDRANAHVLAVRASVLGNLRSELARRRKHHRSRRTLGRRTAQLLQNRQHERRRLAGARLSAREHVATGKNRRDSLGLNRSRRAVALFGHGTQ